jgi:hypothetical protein
MIRSEEENTAANVKIDFDVWNTQLPSTDAYPKMIGDCYYIPRFFNPLDGLRQYLLEPSPLMDPLSILWS